MRWKTGSWGVALVVAVALALLPFMFGAPTDTGFGGIRSVSAQSQEEQPVFALPGTLAAAINQAFGNYLITADGKEYGIVGRTPDIEAQIVEYRELGPDVEVKVWGTLYAGTTVPEIVVDSIQLSDPSVVQRLTPQPTNTPVPPSITVASQVINVRAGPGTDYPAIGSLTLGNSCPIIGRNADSTWWRVLCDNGTTGWVFNSIVTVSGDTSSVPIVTVAPPPPTPTPAPTLTPTPAPPTISGWRASFFNNRDLAGSPVAVLDVGAVSFDWAYGAPLEGMPADNFSVRFERTLSFEGGNTEFVVRVDDGARVWLDDELIINDWREQSVRELRTTRNVSAGNHYVRIDYFEASGAAILFFSTNRTDTITIPGSGDWGAAYFNNTDLAGSPVLVRFESRGGTPYDQDWGGGSPAPGIVPNDNWSARYRGRFYFDSGDYRFYARSDDGVRVYIDGLRVIDAWYDGYKEPSNRFNRLGAGTHEIVVEFYERGGTAYNRVWWNREGGQSDRPHRDP